MHKQYWAVVSLLLVSAFCCLNAYADSTSTFSVDVEQVVLELNVPATPGVIDLHPTASGAAFGTTNIPIKVATNNMTGCTTTVSLQNNVDSSALIRTELIGEEEDYRRINTLAPTDPVSTGYTEESFTANAWGYKVTGDNYFGVSSVNPTISSPAWVVEDPTNGTISTLTLAAKVDATTPSGAYETTLVFNAVTNITAAKDTVSFDKNDENASGFMDGFVVLEGESATLPLNSFTAPSGKKFLGWSTTSNGQGGRFFDDGATYSPAGVGYNRNVTLYAIWADENFPTTTGGTPGTTSLQRAYEIAYTAAGKGMYIPNRDSETGEYDGTYREATAPEDYYGIAASEYRFLIQDMSTDLCASVTEVNSMAHVLDIRDYASYWIGKPLDGRCWMLDNLALDPTNSFTKSRLSSENTNATDAALRNLIGTQTTSKPGWATTPVRSGHAYTYTDPVVDLTGKDSVAADSLSQEQGWKNGVWYSLCAAAASTYCYPESQYVWDVNDAFTIKEDMCPVNWRLPAGSITQDPRGDEFNKMYAPFPYATQYSFRLVHRLPYSNPPDWVAGSSILLWSSTICREGCNSAASIGDGSYNFNLPLVSWFQANIRCIAK